MILIALLQSALNTVLHKVEARADAVFLVPKLDELLEILRSRREGFRIGAFDLLEECPRIGHAARRVQSAQP